MNLEIETGGKKIGDERERYLPNFVKPSDGECRITSRDIFRNVEGISVRIRGRRTVAHVARLALGHKPTFEGFDDLEDAIGSGRRVVRDQGLSATARMNRLANESNSLLRAKGIVVDLLWDVLP